MGKKPRRNGSYAEEEEEKVLMGFSAVYMWQDPTVTAPVFLAVLVTLISICYYSILSVLAYSSLFLLGTATGIKGYVYIMNNLLKKDVANPLAAVEAYDATVSKEKVEEVVVCTTSKVNFAIVELRGLFLIHDYIDSIKFGLALWFITYVGSWFNAMTLIVLAWVGLFTLPKVYANNSQTFDPIFEKIQGHLDEVKGKINQYLPSKKPVVAEEKKEE